MGGGGVLANADVIKGGGGRLMLTPDRGRVKFSKILLTSYVNAPISRHNLKLILQFQ